MKDLYKPICYFYEDSFDNIFDDEDDFEIDASDLSEWLEDGNESESSASEEPSLNSKESMSSLNSTESITFGPILSNDCFDDKEHPQTRPKRRRSRSGQEPPRRRLRMTQDNQSDDFNYMDTASSARSSPQDEKYNEVMRELMMSMKISDLSLVSSNQESTQPSLSSLDRLAGLMSGKRSSLTSSLEHSRKHLRQYLALVLTSRTL